MWKNTLLWVTTDNGGMAQWQDGFPASASSNFPLRAGKATLFEGGVRGVSFVTGGFLPSSMAGRQVEGLLQHVDIAATIANLGGAKLPLTDGYDVWSVIAGGEDSPRTEVPLNIDTACALPRQEAVQFSAVISGKWKLISGSSGMYDGWWSNGDYAHEDIDAHSSNVTVDGKAVWLFNLDVDHTERTNVALENPEVVTRLQARLDELADPNNGYTPSQDNSVSPLALPVLHGGVWAPWQKSARTFDAFTV